MSSGEELSPPVEHAVPGEPGEISPYEKHRPLVREADKKFSRLYGFGGGGALAAGALVLIVAWVAGIASFPTTFVVAVTVVLVGLFVVRSLVNRKRTEIRAAVESYCELNEIDLGELREFYAGERIYPYFEALFETRERQ